MIRNNKGFTLIEVAIALVIMAGAMVILKGSSSGSLMRIRKAEMNYNVTELLERKITELSIKHRDKRADQIGDESGNFGNDFPQYRWTMTTQPFEMPDLGDIAVSDGGASQDLVSMLKQMQDIMSKSIVEATVTVYVRGKEREVPFSVTTYFVDFQGAQVPGLGGGG